MGALALASAAGAKSSAEKSMRQQTKSLHNCKQDSLPPSCFIAINTNGAGVASSFLSWRKCEASMSSLYQILTIKTYTTVIPSELQCGLVRGTKRGSAQSLPAR
jgi:hypothetical protein